MELPWYFLPGADPVDSSFKVWNNWMYQKVTFIEVPHLFSLYFLKAFRGQEAGLAHLGALPQLRLRCLAGQNTITIEW